MNSRGREEERGSEKGTHTRGGRKEKVSEEIKGEGRREEQTGQNERQLFNLAVYAG